VTGSRGAPVTGPDEAGQARPTRLLLVTNIYPTPDRPHSGAFVARRVAALRERGVEVIVAAPSGYGGSSLIRHARIAWRALTARGPIDGVEAHPLYAAGVIGLLAAKLRRKPLLAYAHGSDVTDYAVRSRFHRFFARRVARGAAAVVANSKETADYAARLGPAARVVSPGVDLQALAPAGRAERAALRHSLGLPSGPLALFLGSISEHKGADLFARAVESSPRWQGVMVGDGPLAGRLASTYPKLLRHAPVAPSEVAAWLQAVDVVVVPSRREGFGLAAVEAMACATPVIAAAAGGLPEIVSDGENALLVPPGDPAAIAGALDRLLDPELRARLGAAGPAAASAHDVRRAAAKMAEIWAELGVRA
jgi:glycosyltransferase involved in cell wall biosynthesis